MKKDITKMFNVKLNHLIELLSMVKKLELPFEIDKVLATPVILTDEGYGWAMRHYRELMTEDTSDDQVRILVDAFRDIINTAQQACCAGGRMITLSSQRMYKSGYRIEGLCERNGDRYIALYFQLPSGRVYFFYDIQIVEDMVACVNWGMDEEDEVEELPLLEIPKPRTIELPENQNTILISPSTGKVVTTNGWECIDPTDVVPTERKPVTDYVNVPKPSSKPHGLFGRITSWAIALRTKGG